MAAYARRGGAGLRARPRAHQAGAGAAVRDADLQRPLVLAAAGGAAGVHAARHGVGHRNRQGQARIAAAARVVGRTRRGRCTTTAWPPTRRATASSTGRPPASSTSGRCRPRPGPRPRSPIQSRCDAGDLHRSGPAACPAASILPSSTSPPRSAVDRRLLPYDLRASAVHVRMLARQGLIEPAEADAIVAALASVEVEPDARDEDVHSAIERLLGELGPRVPRRPQPQRPGADRDAAVGQAGLRRPDRGRARAGRRAARPRRRRGRRRAARLHPRPARTAGVAGPAPGRPRLGADPRRPAAVAGARGGRRVPAGRGRAGRLEPAARPGVGGRGAGLRPLVCELAGCGVRPRLPDRAAATRPHWRWCTCRGSARSWCCGRRPSTASPSWTTRRHRQLDDAAEEEPGRGGAGAGQGRHRDRALDRAAARSRGCRSRTTATCRRTSGPASTRSTTWPGR